jgi:OOP family OmpA-OmpF porin
VALAYFGASRDPDFGGWNMRFATRAIALLLLGLLWTSPAFAQSTTALPGATDPPIISRFKGSIIVGQEKSDFDSYRVPMGVPTMQPRGAMDDKFTKQQDVEGKVTRTMYFAPPNSSPLLVYRSYEDALKQAGFVTLFSCALSTCYGNVSGGNLAYFWTGHWPMGGNSLGDPRILVAKLSRPAGDVYVALLSAPVGSDPSRVYTFVDEIEIKPITGGLVTVNAAALATDISQTGHATIYGIYFDTGKAELKPESGATLSEISKLLAANASLKLHVVGHTDNVGTLASNMTLSKQRADAVVAALVSKYHVAAARLDAAGVGPLAPVGSNDTDDGRVKNRRVELVKQ